MRIETTKDILIHSQKFHRAIADYYHRLGASSDKERVKLLLNYLEEREKQLENVIIELEETASPKILNTWFARSECENKMNRLLTLIKGDSPLIREVIDLFVLLDDCLIEIYNKVVESSETEEVGEFFNNLSNLSKRYKQKAISNAAWLEDY